MAVVKTSMLYWWPKVKDLQIPTPRTEVIKIPYEHLIKILDGKMIPKRYMNKVVEAGEALGYPLFMRTDMGSAKHSWERTCFVSSQKELNKHIWALIDETLAAGMFGELDPNALVFRELLQLNSSFTAFSGLPISAERRYFVRDGEVESHHHYWIQDAIEKTWKQPSEPEWRKRLALLNKETLDEVRLLTPYASSIGKTLGGYWSVDFEEDKDGTWYFIDMAEGEKSWHPAMK